MTTRTSGFKFIDLPTSAEGRIRPFSGSGQQSVFRASDVERLAAELAVDAAGRAAEREAAASSEATEGAEGGRVRRRDPVKLVGTRISMDSRWAEISEMDIAAWLDALE